MTARRFTVVLGAAALALLGPVAAASAADEEPPPEEPVRGGPVLTIPVSTDDDAFAMVLVGAVAPQPRLTVDEPLEIEAQFAGSAMDTEVCVSLSGVGCIGTVTVPEGGVVSTVVDLPDGLVAGTYTVSLESPALGSVVLGESIVENAPAAPETTIAPDDGAAVGTDTETVVEPTSAPVDASRDEDGIWAVLIGAIGVILIGLIGVRDRRRHQPEEAPADRLSSLELPTATQLPDRSVQRTGGVAVRTKPLAPGEGYVLVALQRDDAGVAERTVARYAELDEAMQGARTEAKEDTGRIMWWEVRRDGSTLPVWIIEGKVRPVATEGAANET